jgi:hypothetical protein
MTRSPSTPAELDRARRSDDATADRLALPDPRIRSERGRRASVRQTQHMQHAQRAEHGDDDRHGTSGSQQLPTLDGKATTCIRNPSGRARASGQEAAFGASPSQGGGGEQVRREGAEEGEWVGRSWHLHGRSPRGLADSGRQVKAKSGLDPPTTARQSRSLPDRGGSSPSVRRPASGRGERAHEAAETEFGLRFHSSAKFGIHGRSRPKGAADGYR